MIVDTSALCAIVMIEPSARQLQRELLRGTGLIPAPAYVEFRRLIEGRMRNRAREAREVIADAFLAGVRVEPFGAEDADIASEAVLRWGSGHGGPLNLIDLMVYAVARRTARPILCTGRDFTSTDADVHPASRRS